MAQERRNAGMIARGFKSVVWVGAVGGAALGCYMLSLQVATERAELAKVERGIIAVKQEIRSLQTELGTRGRMSQLERWNAEVLALSAPASGQFLQDAFTLARLERTDPTLEDRAATVRTASAETAPAAPPPQPQAAPKAVQAVAPAPVPPPAAVVHRASLATAGPAAKARPETRADDSAKPETLRPARLDSRLADEIARAAKAEGSGGN
jgi:hypothetical protein